MKGAKEALARLRALQFAEARFLMGEVPNRMLLQMCLESMGAKVG